MFFFALKEEIVTMFEELLKKRRSIRKFKNTPVERETIERLLKAALLSPSSRNIRPWRFILVDDEALISKLSSVKPHGSKFMETAKAAVVVVADTNACDVWVEDASIASAVLLFEAEALGLGACWCQIRRRPHDEETSAEDYVRTLLNIPEGFAVESIIAMGYRDEQVPPYTKDDLLLDKLRYNTFDIPYTSEESSTK